MATVLHGATDPKPTNHTTPPPGQSQKLGKSRPYCPYCDNSEHFLNQCLAIQKLSREQIVDWIRSNKRCWRCARTHQAAQCDLKKPCAVCQGKHLKVLHEVNSRRTAEPLKEETYLVSTNAEVLHVDHPSASSKVLLKVVKVLLCYQQRKVET